MVVNGGKNMNENESFLPSPGRGLENLPSARADNAVFWGQPAVIEGIKSTS
jgi:hypothetical protein